MHNLPYEYQMEPDTMVYYDVVDGQVSDFQVITYIHNIEVDATEAVKKSELLTKSIKRKVQDHWDNLEHGKQEPEDWGGPSDAA